jgi:hypothetical protein
MAYTAVSDIVNPTVFTPYLAENLPEKLIMLQQSGILMPPGEEIGSRFATGGRKIEVPYWEDLDRTEPTIIDDTNTALVPSKVTASDMTAYKHRMAKAHAAKTIAGFVATGRGDAPMNRVGERIGAYWGKMKELRIIATSQGVIADNVANDSGDMVYSAYSDVASPTAANRISFQSINRARLTMGENLDDLRVIAMHTNVYGTLLDDEKIEFKKPSEAPFEVPYYAGMMVIHSESMPVTAGTNSDAYDCYLFAAGAFMHIDEVPAQPTQYGNLGTEIYRDPFTGSGGGEDTLITRRFELLHPTGTDFLAASMAKADGALLAELRLAANWNRKWSRKNIKFAALKVNV